MLLKYFEQISGDEACSVLAEIDQAADRLTELVDNLLDLARLESGVLATDHQPVAMADVLAAVVRDASRRHPDRVIEFAAEQGLPSILGDARRLGQVAANLIENAVKYSPDGGPVVWAGCDPGGGVRFAVSDHGIGMAADVLGHIFNRFYRVDNERTRAIGGTGLGLAICHGGGITVSSAEGAGSTFTVTLPPG